MKNTIKEIAASALEKRFQSMLKEAEILMQPFGVDPKVGIFTHRKQFAAPFKTYVCLSSNQETNPVLNLALEKMNALPRGEAEQSEKYGHQELNMQAIISGEVRKYFKKRNSIKKEEEYAILKACGIKMNEGRWYGIPFGKKDFIEGYLFLVLSHEDFHKVDLDLFEELYENINKPESTGFYFDIANQEEFGNMLHERLHNLLAFQKEWETNFMLICNLYNRDKNREDKHIESLIYAGTNSQRKLLEKKTPKRYIRNEDQVNAIAEENQEVAETWLNQNWTKSHDEEGWFQRPYEPDCDKEARKKDRDHNWDYLKKNKLSSTDKQVETYDLFKKFAESDFNLKDIKISRLEEYFEELSNEFQQHEFPIYGEYFDFKKDLYIGIPLLGLGTFQGIVWILFKPEEAKRFDKNNSFVKDLIRIFQLEYDSLIFSWDLVGENINIRAIPQRLLYYIEKEPAYFDTNPILRECGIKAYYENNNEYIKKRLQQNNVVPDRFITNQRSTATTTTLLDSFAHNISAHTLITLVNWYRELAEYLLGKAEDQYKMGRATNPLIKFVQWAKVHGKESLSSLPLELHRFFKFLLEKGAFWSGITRKTNFAGKISNFFNVFWFDFINNALYLGTIANSEQINRIKVNVTIYEDENKIEGDDFKNVKIIKRNEHGELLGGEFAIIDLNEVDAERDMHEESEKSYSQFVSKGKAFEKIALALKEFDVFFPGGIVGKHSFFTLIENEIRNVKHYKDEQTLAEMRKKGLQLNISLHLRPVDSDRAELENSDKKELVKIGVWLNHAITLNSKLVTQRIEELKRDVIIPDTFRPRLGGSVQDKNCAAQLLTNNFENVQDKTSPLGFIYYPWIKVATCLAGQTSSGEVQEFEVSLRKYNLYAHNQFQSVYDKQQGKGYLKKYFHLWQGEEVFHAQDVQDFNLEEPSRFQFVEVAKEKTELKDKILKGEKNIIRVIQYNPNIKDSLTAYPYWLPHWMKNDKEFCIDFMVESSNDTVARFYYKNGEVRFFNKSQVAEDSDCPEVDVESWIKERRFKSIKLIHGKSPTNDPAFFNFRSHGRLISQYWHGSGHSLGNIRISSLSSYELFEVLVSQICIFDNRIYSRVCQENNKGKKDTSGQDIHRLQLQKLESYREQLGLDFRAETKEHWDAAKEGNLFRFHFLIVHLSFIESMLSINDKEYKEKGIKNFIEEQILQPARHTTSTVPENFHLIITTGRGRRQWWDIIKDTPYARFTSFRQIEAINAAVGDAVEISDDMDMKINLAKILFGS